MGMGDRLKRSPFPAEEVKELGEARGGGIDDEPGGKRLFVDVAAAEPSSAPTDDVSLVANPLPSARVNPKNLDLVGLGVVGARGILNSLNFFSGERTTGTTVPLGILKLSSRSISPPSRIRRGWSGEV